MLLRHGEGRSLLPSSAVVVAHHRRRRLMRPHTAGVDTARRHRAPFCLPPNHLAALFEAHQEGRKEPLPSIVAREEASPKRKNRGTSLLLRHREGRSPLPSSAVVVAHHRRRRLMRPHTAGADTARRRRPPFCLPPNHLTALFEAHQEGRKEPLPSIAAGEEASVTELRPDATC
nr:hypothetical protein Iba_chr15cCG6520 [Ipomoea batatas]